MLARAKEFTQDAVSGPVVLVTAGFGAARLALAKQGIGWGAVPAVAAVSWPIFGLFAASMVFFAVSVWLFMTDRRGAVRLFWTAFAADYFALSYANTLGQTLPVLAVLAVVGLAMTALSAYRLRSRFTPAAV